MSQLTHALASLTLIATSAAADDWPQFLGPGRSNRSAETGLLAEWPEAGPELLWTVEGLGHGYSTVSVADGLVYTTGDIEKELVVTALDLSGEVVWRSEAGPAFTGSVPGSRSTPTVVDGKLYLIGGNGHVTCLDAKAGEQLWQVDSFELFGGREVAWGVAESPLVDGQNVVVCPGGQDVFMAALDRDTGETRWTCTGVGDTHSHSSPSIVEHGGLRQIVALTGASVVGVAPDTGKLLWKHPHQPRVNCDIPLHHEGSLYVFGTWGFGATRIDLIVDGEACSVEEVWHTVEMDNEHGGVMLIDGYLYGQADGSRKDPHMACLDAETGEQVWRSDELSGQASSALTYIEGLLYIVTDKGEVGLVRPHPERLEIISQFQMPKGGRGLVWAFPVVSNGRFYLRHGDFLYAYGVR